MEVQQDSSTDGLNLEAIGGVRFSRLRLWETIELLARWCGDSQFARARWFACVNPHSVETALRDPAFGAAIRSADLVTADGTGIVIASRILRGRIPERVCGPDIFPMLCEKLNRERPGTRMFFLGATEATLAALARKVAEVYPNLVMAGTLAPPFCSNFSEMDTLAMVDAINAAKADVLWVGLGAPKQEKWVQSVIHRLNVRVVGPVGGVFDFFTGRVKLPPLWAQKVGLIWLVRLCQEPRRLWRRNLDSPIFLSRVLRQRLTRKPG
jgi:N-acetylglucosaminyldiphosphoundecaprenol N-acetyl-beta-D-mannosaminyltransferase